MRAAAYRNGSKWAVSTKTMAEGEALLTELNAKVNDITGGTRGLTNAELLLLAAEYNIDSSYLFDSQTESTMQYFSTKNFSADYQAQLMIENALQQAMNNGPLPISMGNGNSWLSLFSPLYAESSKDPNVVRALNRLQRDEFNKREYFYMNGVKYERVDTPKGSYFEGISGGETIRFELTENGVVRYNREGRGQWNTDKNATFNPDGELWSGAQEWWNNSKQNIQQIFQLYGEGVAASSEFALFIQSKERESSGNTDSTNSNNSKKPITTLDYKGSGQVGTVSIITSNIEAQVNFWDQFEGSLHHWYGKYGKTELSKANSLFHSDISVGKDRNGANDWYGPNTDFTVVRAGTMNGYGGFVEIGVGNDQVVLMGHFTEINEKVYNAKTIGQKLPAGTFLGRTSFTIGSSTGPHLHVIGHDSRGLVHRDIVLNWLRGL